ncbi:MAG: phospho-sugar mutase [Clostridia bacterium]|nr:phospho-sugar mutase [Clostridia bacterium]
MNQVQELYDLWRKNAVLDPDLTAELNEIEGKDEEILDRFYKCLEFGTGGLRGVIGAGTNRMNVYTVGQATQGLANYLNEAFENPSVAIAYDSRIKSQTFAKEAAGVLAANGVKVYFYPVLVPTPMLSFAVRRLGCSSGIVITASHNPSKYNGYKCYDPRGYQMTDEAAARTLEYINSIDIFNDVKRMSFEDAQAQDMIDFIEDWLFDEYYDCINAQRLDTEICEKSGLKVIYTPLNGTGNRPVRAMLSRMGLSDVRIVKEQEEPDGTFPTCPFPNPEIRQVFECGLEMTKEFPADLFLATDPDCDRAGIAVRHNGEYVLMSGNEVGAMLAEYLLTRRKELGTLPENPVIIKSFVTTDLVQAIADKHGAQVINTLTGFKYIGEQITELEEKGEEERFLIGMEESYGYLCGTHARDKDGVVAVTMIAEMAAYYKTKGLDLVDFYESISQEYGIYRNSLLNFTFEGAQGMETMKNIMDSLRTEPPKALGGLEVIAVSDYKTSIAHDLKTGEKTVIALPKSNVLQFKLPGGSSAIVRPSGTEPKIKVYITACAGEKAAAQALETAIGSDMKQAMGIQ